ncbi:unnamed protein product [Leptosia nina]|uniref:FLYWCH-type domain-containing protein n=1 Tax=Leptosia nina TaxID=320188 RepID=A0AAV1J496_9NEOP
MIGNRIFFVTVTLESLNALIVRSPKGNFMLLIDGYRFSKHREVCVRGIQKIRWQCAKGCNATLTTFGDAVVKFNLQHNHQAPFIAYSKRGNPILVLKGYRYSLKVTKAFEDHVIRRWQCSTHTNRGCLATVITQNEHIVKTKNEHNHVQSNIRNVKLHLSPMLLGFQ